MMKKSRWMMLLAALICLSMLFVSCGSEGTFMNGEQNPSMDGSPDKDPDGDSSTDNDGPGNETVIYRAITDEWSKYVAYKEPEKTVTSATLVVSGGAEQNGVFLTQRRMVMEHYDDEWELTATTYATCVYSVITGTAITPEYTETVGVNGSSDKKYEFRYTDCMVEVIGQSLRETEEGGFVWGVDFIDRYTSSGEKVTSEATFMMSGGAGEYDYTYLGDVCYISKSGSILKVCARGEERSLVEYDEICGDYGYVIGGQSLRIFDTKNDAVLVDYVFSGAYGEEDDAVSVSVSVLSNGNVLVRYKRSCQDSEESFTYESAGDKTLLSYVLIDPAAGTASELPVNFRIDKLVTKNEDQGTNLSPVGEYQYAEIVKITDGTLDPKAIPVILDNNLSIVAELPLIFKNQTSFVRAIDSDLWLLKLDVNGREYGYTVNLSTGTVALYVNEKEVMALDGGFLYQGKLYDDRMTALSELDWAISKTTVNGILLTSDADGVKRLLFIENGSTRSVLVGNNGDSVSAYGALMGCVLTTSYDSNETFYTVRNEIGSVLFVGNAYPSVSSFGEYKLVSVWDDGGNVSYYSVR